ncbi:AbrB/MazE/SpoVT family DNA-binding domain-containing protein [Paraburkholderia elongata]|uniref:AbrB/MazE/SpoVT family DNA-binding domain-containing protein n=1 Tax=Paraburkholderia elongata TaxID=2675747 RepID=UPI001F26AE71|nr:type II toxin-antitoxin system PrlF family antitoxin [Paraburkholderia elongata]
MAESRLATRGRTTVPAQVRKALGAKPGTRLVWHVMPDGKVLYEQNRSRFWNWRELWNLRSKG